MNKQMTVQPIYGILLSSKKEHIFEAYSHWDEFQRNLAELKKKFPAAYNTIIPYI